MAFPESRLVRQRSVSVELVEVNSYKCKHRPDSRNRKGMGETAQG